ncbi:PREDICTED: receptor-type guanylate cyclase gcy-28-like [Nicrophorus vespilloides]|uniref:guanylate cyclase n=1 Tax=Nicrophorus vespilloides TaxID=110193 RepID=A0ABM1MJ88_NICVS|nr:PREDICTED: receptor-type guanylate cyclase gcy-28-like [Nicrophorus vespilloides]
MFSYPSCSDAKTTGEAANMHYKNNVIAYIGPACICALEPVASLAAYWNIPIITGMGDQPLTERELSVTSSCIMDRLQTWNDMAPHGIINNNSKLYPTLTRLSYCERHLKLVFTSVVKYFGWKHIALVVDKTDLFSIMLGKNLEYELKRQGLQVFVIELKGNDEEMYDKYLKDASRYARVMILSIRASLVRKFMLAAHGLGMTKGDWVFMDLEMYKGSYWVDSIWSVGDKYDTIAKEAYEALIRVSLLQPTSDRFQDFANKVKERAQTDYNYIMNSREDVDFAIGAFYDGVYLLGMALNETLSMGGNIRDGLAITKLMWGRDFHGISGYVAFDHNGDRVADYSIQVLHPKTGKFYVVAHYYDLHKEYLPVPEQKIYWPGGREDPPLDIPEPGFLDDHPKRMNYDIILIIYGIVALGLILALIGWGCFKCTRQVRTDQNIMQWRVRPDEMMFELGILYDYEPEFPSLPESLDVSSSRPSFINSLQSTPIGMYKGTRVFIKKIVKKNMDINKKVLSEIKQVINIGHENTIRFLGACIENPGILIITEYCPRGSLRDVLDNNEINLNWKNKLSLIENIAKGMQYLHNSEVSVHGKLNSHNCLIDGDFVLKICDFGLTTLVIPDDISEDINHYHKLLWVAPELLPLTVVPGIPATQKGDVYSFAIILEEIILRAGPFFVTLQHEQICIYDILKRVADREIPPFRPVVDETNCHEDLILLMKTCWEDNPVCRPPFNVICRAVQNIGPEHY